MTWGAEAVVAACGRLAATAADPVQRTAAWEDMTAALAAARGVRAARARHGCEIVRYDPSPAVPRCDAPAYAAVPVLLVHGYGGTETVWTPLVHALHEAGFSDTSALRYDSFGTDLPDIAAELVRAGAEAMARTGSSAVHLVGHSLGGLVIQCAMQWAGLAAHARTVVTIATPYAGTPAARLAVGPCARRMRPGSAVLAPSPRREGGGTRWVAYYSPHDVVVPPSSARLDDSRPDSTNIAVEGCGHLSIARHPAVVDSIVEQLAGLPALVGHCA